MNTIRKSLMIGLGALCMGTATLAAHAAEPSHDHAVKQDDHAARQKANGNRHAEGMARHMAALHDKLKLSSAQEPAWAAFIAAAKPQTPAERPDRASVAKMTAPERLETWITMSQARLAAQQNALTALKTFYAELTPEQKKIFDDNVPGGRRGGMHGMGGAMAGGMHPMHGMHSGMRSGMRGEVNEGMECDMHEQMHGKASGEQPAKSAK